MKKIVIVVGTRPNFIKITQFEKEFNKYPGQFDYKLIHTGQHYDDNMSKLFFEQFQLKKPDVFLNMQGKNPSEQIGQIIIKLSEYFSEWKPDLVVVVGDVNSTLAAAIAANKTHTPLAHLESGLRSHDRGMPEEHNRVMTDAISDLLFVTEQSGLDTLKKDREDHSGIHFVGNTMIDTLVAFEDDIQASPILEKLAVKKGEYALMTMHRPSNVDHKDGLEKMLQVIEHITDRGTLVFPIHPRTMKSLEKYDLDQQLKENKKVILTPPLDYLAFQKLIANSSFVITDSGGIQEETTFRQVPCLTLRENTERPSTIEIGSNMLMPFDIEKIHAVITSIFDGTYKKGQVPPKWDGQATERIVKILLEKKKEVSNSEVSDYHTS
ncbi:MAG: UDP-N-acetylglucosamine 2-epimerase (non-hydrolyzing) [Saprospiraceae bacterium]|nr:UDP-N-acetylglucosamine 2-epimerase (non-hydrolyzing) [Saprospiraceae bacterium]